MRESRAQREGRRLEDEKRAKLRGTARVRLECLDLPIESARYRGRLGVEDLVSKFQREGCLHEDSRFQIRAIIDQAHLERATAASRTTADALLEGSHGEPPELQFPGDFKLECLHGWRRVQAGRETLPLQQQWWTIELYHDSCVALAILWLPTDG